MHGNLLANRENNVCPRYIRLFEHFTTDVLDSGYTALRAHRGGERNTKGMTFNVRLEHEA